MLSRIRTNVRNTEDKEQGFTLIELLVVMIIIGILAAIAIPTFLNQRKNGYRASLKADLKNAATAVESAAVEKAGDYTLVGTLAAGAVLWNGTSNPTALKVEYTGTTGNTITLTKVTASTYCLTGVNSSLPTGTAEQFAFDKANGSPIQGGIC